MKVVLTPELCEISGYFKTLSEDPECKEVDIPDEYEDFIQLILKYDEQEQINYITELILDKPESELIKYKQLCDYFLINSALHTMYMTVYRIELEDRKVDILMDTMEKIFIASDTLIDVDFVEIFETARLKLLIHEQERNLYMTPLSWWNHLCESCKTFRILATIIEFCPYEQIIRKIITIVFDKNEKEISYEIISELISCNRYLSHKIKIELCDYMSEVAHIRVRLSRSLWEVLKLDDISKFRLECVNYGRINSSYPLILP